MAISVFWLPVGLILLSVQVESFNVKNIFKSRPDRRVISSNDYIRTQFDRSNWMHSASEKIGPKKLMDMKLIGSHNSASYTIDKLLDSMSVCQNADITSQLTAGVRYIDLRIGTKHPIQTIIKEKIGIKREKFSRGITIRVGHGPHAGAKLDGIFKEIVDWSKKHPKEFLIVSIDDYGVGEMTAREKFEAIKIIKSQLPTDEKLQITLEDEKDWFKLHDVTMGKIWENKRSMLILYGNKLLSNLDNGDGKVFTMNEDEAKRAGLMPRKWYIYDPWADTPDIKILFDKVNAAYKGRQRGKLFVSQLILTATPGKTRSIETLTGKLQKSGEIKKWLMDPNHSDFAIVHLDFIVGATSDERDSAREILDLIINQG